MPDWFDIATNNPPGTMICNTGWPFVSSDNYGWRQFYPQIGLVPKSAKIRGVDAPLILRPAVQAK